MARKKENFESIKRPGIEPREVAALVPAHNEELVITQAINSLKRILPKENIYIASDASTDQTVSIAETAGVNVLQIEPNRGKAGALSYAIDHFSLYRYKAIIFMDSDSEVDQDYLTYALPFFDDPGVSAIAGHLETKWYEHLKPKWSSFFSAYRLRLYKVLQAVMRYGQTWKFTNVTMIVPGFASIYRTSVLKDIQIQVPGLVIEDYNMTFEIHKKKLGKIAYHPKAFALTDDPHSIRDYRKQVKRWNLGLWQTVRRHKIWPSFFSFALSTFLIEVFIFSLFLLFCPLLIIWIFIKNFFPFEGVWIPSPPLSFYDIAVGVLAADYLLTAIVAAVFRKPILFLYGLGFIILRFLDAFYFLYALPLAFIEKSTGKWVSPIRSVSIQEKKGKEFQSPKLLEGVRDNLKIS